MDLFQREGSFVGVHENAEVVEDDDETGAGGGAGKDLDGAVAEMAALQQLQKESKRRCERDSKMIWFVGTFLRNLIGCFKGRMWIWHVIAILLTVVMVMSGFDWMYFTWTRAPLFRSCAFPAIRIGSELPILLPLVLLVCAIVSRNNWIVRMAAATVQAVILGSLVSSTYKAFTGRVHPMHEVGADISRDFRFGFWRGGVFWGWPSSHTTIAFAMAVTVFMLLPKLRWAGWLVIAYALYVGLAVSVTIHWFSDFVAGAIIGSVIGVVVGRCFRDGPGNQRLITSSPTRKS